ncbi:MAG: helix-turn-helix domain-containing protein [Bacteroidota bacterium]
MSDSARPDSRAPSFESDFRDLRDARGLSLDDLNGETRIPVDVLRRFESGDLLADGSFSDVYVRAFVKSYAKALGVPQARAIDAFEAHRSGRYAGQLRDDYTPPKAPPPSSPKPPADAASGAGNRTPSSRAPSSGSASDEPTVDKTAATSAPRKAPEASTPPPAVPAPAVDALRTGGTATPKPAAAPEASALRVKRPIEPAAKRSFDKNWGTLGLLAFVLIAVCAAAVYLLIFRTDSDDTTLVADDTEQGTDAATPEETPDQGPTGPRLQTPITVTVEATDGGLQWFRITSDSDERFPDWIDEGTDKEYTADSSLVIWGEGNSNDTAYDFEQATLELQGLRWRPASGSAVRITLQNGQALLDSLAAAGVSATSAPEASGAAPQPE